MKNFFLGAITAAIITALSAHLAFALSPAIGREYDDVKVSDYFYDHVRQLSNEDILTGFSDDTFRPGQNINRADTAVIMGRFYNIYEDDYFYMTERVKSLEEFICDNFDGSTSAIAYAEICNLNEPL